MALWFHFQKGKSESSFPLSVSSVENIKAAFYPCVLSRGLRVTCRCLWDQVSPLLLCGLVSLGMGRGFRRSSGERGSDIGTLDLEEAGLGAEWEVAET